MLDSNNMSLYSNDDSESNDNDEDELLEKINSPKKIFGQNKKEIDKEYR